MAYLPEDIPLPLTDEIDTKEWWEACSRRQLVVQQCASCKTFRHPPAPTCYECSSFEFQWSPVNGTGEVISYILPHHPAHPALRDHGPYNVIVVELVDAGVRMVGNLIDTPIDEVKIGQKVIVTWEERGGITFAQWRRAE